MNQIWAGLAIAAILLVAFRKFLMFCIWRAAADNALAKAPAEYVWWWQMRGLKVAPHVADPEILMMESKPVAARKS